MTPAAQKALLLVVLTSVMSVVVFLAFQFWLPQAVAAPLWGIPLALLSFLWLALMAVSLSLVPSVGLRVLLVVLPALTVALVGWLSIATISGSVLLLICSYLASRSFVREQQNRIVYRTAQIYGPGLKILILGLMIALISLLLPALLQSGAEGRLQVTARHLEPMLSPLQPLIQNLLPGYTSGATIDQILTRQLEAQIEGSLPPGTVLPPDVHAQQIGLARVQLGERLGVRLQGDETLPVLVANILNTKMTNLSDEVSLLVPLILVVVVFLTLRALMPFLVWPAIGSIALLLAMLRATHFARVTPVQLTTERLEL